jgi:hypothetical protein
MTTLTQSPRVGEFILSEANGSLSRTSITVVSGAGSLESGSVMGVITASSKYTLFNPAAEDGSETAAAILYSKVDATSADQDAVVISRLAEVKNAFLQWKTGVTANQKTTALASLATKYIISRS